MPQPQADNRFPGGAANQPPVPLGSTAGGEKTAPGESELKKPTPAIDKPALKTSFTAAAPSTASITASIPFLPKITAAATATASSDAKETGSDKVVSAEKPDAPRAHDWGLSLKRNRPGMKLKIGAGAAALIVAAGGYVAWLQLFVEKPAVENPTQEAIEVTQAQEPGHLDPAHDSPDGADPFDEVPAVRSAADSRSSPAAEPRRMEARADDANPIDRRGTAGAASKKNILREIGDLDEDEPLELAQDTRPQETSRLGRGIEKPASGPSLGGGGIDSQPSRAEPSRTEPSAARPRGRQAGTKSGPGFSTGGGDDADLADDLTDEKLDGYSIAGRRNAVSAKGSSRGPAISIIDADDDPDREEKLDGYVPQDVTSHRARSKTLVVRATDADRRPANSPDQGYPAARRDAASRSAEFGDDEGHDGASASPVGDDEPFARPDRGELDAIQRRSAPPAAERRFLPLSRSAGPAGQLTGPAGDTYRVLPDDNFWNISRKQYGTARYYQALMRYNQDRVPDPQRLRPGMQIMTPPAAVLEQRFPELIEKPSRGASSGGGAIDRSAMRPGFEKPSAADDPDEPAARTSRETGSSGYFYGKSGQPLYRIGPDDTLTGIAQRHLGRASRWHEIYEKNQDVLQSPDNLTQGTVIRLPVDASRVSLSPDSDSRR
jgi:nucleoid-associated protein YgaU